MKSHQTKFWLICTSKDHVLSAIDQKIVQINHGKKFQLQKMKQGDYVIFYSSKEKIDAIEKCQKFTGIGKLPDDEIFQQKVTEEFIPWRRNMIPIQSIAIDIRPLIEELDFIPNKQKWGFPLRFGFLEIGKSDFKIISEKMIKNSENYL